MIQTSNTDILLTVTKLNKRFGDVLAVNDLNFEIKKNEIFGLLGPNGAGKTTTINMICGLIQADSGTIHYSNTSGKKNEKMNIGYCPQENIFYPKLTCLEQLVFIGNMYNISSNNAKSKAIELLTLLGLESKLHHQAYTLSGGMKRRLNICLALIHDPKFLILDEPEAGLDPQSRVLVRDFIKSLSKTRTILLTTHNMDEADRLADRIAIMDYGKLLLVDTSQNLKHTVGDGDILELEIETSKTSEIPNFLTHIKQKVKSLYHYENKVQISDNSILEKLDYINSVADSSKIKIKEIKVRSTTLEDVFIKKTGRKLRQ